MDNELNSCISELLEQVSDENEFLYRKSTGEIIDRNPEFIDERTLEDIEVNEQDYILLPTQYDIHEYQIMKDFALECPNEQMRDRMLASLGEAEHSDGSRTWFIILGFATTGLHTELNDSVKLQNNGAYKTDCCKQSTAPHNIEVPRKAATLWGTFHLMRIISAGLKK